MGVVTGAVVDAGSDPVVVAGSDPVVVAGSDPVVVAGSDPVVVADPDGAVVTGPVVVCGAGSSPHAQMPMQMQRSNAQSKRTLAFI